MAEMSGTVEKRVVRRRIVAALIPAIAVLGALIVTLMLGPNPFVYIPPALVVPTVGGMAFFGILIWSSVNSSTDKFDMGEVRTAITGSLVIVYFVVLGFVLFLNKPAEINQDAVNVLLTSFTDLMKIVIIFYFGSRSLEEITRIVKGNSEGKS